MARLERNQNLYVGENKIVQNLQLLLLSVKKKVQKKRLSFPTLEKIQWKHFEKGHLPFTLENRKFRLENHMVRVIPSGKLHKTWAVI